METMKMAKYSIIALCILLLTLGVAGLVISLVYGDVLFTITFTVLSAIGCRELHMETKRVS